MVHNLGLRMKSLESDYETDLYFPWLQITSSLVNSKGGINLFDVLEEIVKWRETKSDLEKESE